MTGNRLQLRGHDFLRLPAGPISQTQVVQVIGGQTISGVDCIQYQGTDLTLSQLYDPDVDTVYPDGLGRGWLMTDQGQPDQRVLIRNDFTGLAAPMVGGWVYLVRNVTTLVVASGADAGKSMDVYTVTWTV